MKNLKDFEKKMGKVNKLYDELKRQDLSLDKHIEKFKEAKGLIEDCREFLEEAETEVMAIIETEDGDELEEFE